MGNSLVEGIKLRTSYLVLESDRPLNKKQASNLPGYVAKSGLVLIYVGTLRFHLIMELMMMILFYFLSLCVGFCLLIFFCPNIFVIVTSNPSLSFLHFLCLSLTSYLSHKFWTLCFLYWIDCSVENNVSDSCRRNKVLCWKSPKHYRMQQTTKDGLRLQSEKCDKKNLTRLRMLIWNVIVL